MGTSLRRVLGARRGRHVALLLAAAIVVGLGGCGIGRDLGPTTTDEREIDDVSAVDLRTGGDLTITTGSGPLLRITAGADVLDELTSETRDGVLVLGAAGPRLGGYGDVRYELAVPALAGVRVSGSGDVRVDEIDGKRLDLVVSGSGSVTAESVTLVDLTADISGSGSVRLAGTADQQDVRISGSGDYAAADLATEQTRVVISGSGNADVAADDTLVAEVSGSGHVTYAGDAEVTSRVSGSGSVEES
jgi:hypothetical protein